MSCRTVLITAVILIFLFVCGGAGTIQGWLGQAANALAQKASESAVSAVQESARRAVDGIVKQTPIPISAKYVLGKIQGGADAEGWFGSVVTQTIAVDKTYGKDYRSGQIVPTDAPAAWVLNPIAQVGANVLDGNVVRVQGNDLVQAGINVKRMAPADVRVSSDDTVTICLPEAVVISSHFDNTPGSTATEMQGILQHGDQNAGTLARAAAEKDAAQEAIKNGRILKEAETEAQNGLRNLLLLGLGVKSVNFSPKPCR